MIAIGYQHTTVAGSVVADKLIHEFDIQFPVDGMNGHTHQMGHDHLNLPITEMGAQQKNSFTLSHGLAIAGEPMDSEILPKLIFSQPQRPPDFKKNPKHILKDVNYN